MALLLRHRHVAVAGNRVHRGAGQVLHRAADLPADPAHQQRPQQRQHQADPDQHHQRAVEAGDDRVVGLPDQQRPAAVAHGLHRGEALLPGLGVQVRQVRRDDA